jgi:hypothetical protein
LLFEDRNFLAKATGLVMIYAVNLPTILPWFPTTSHSPLF